MTFNAFTHNILGFLNWFLYCIPAPANLNYNYNFYVCIITLLKKFGAFFTKFYFYFFLIILFFLSQSFLSFIVICLFTATMSFIYRKLISKDLNFGVYLFSLYEKLLVTSPNFFRNIPNPFKYLFFVFITYVLCLRSFFRNKEYPQILYFLCFFFFLNIFFIRVYHFALFTNVQYIILHLILGVYCLCLDVHGEAIGSVVLSHPQAFFSVSLRTYLTRLQVSPYKGVRFVSTRATAGIFLGKSNLTLTGKAFIFIAACTTSSLAVNSYLDHLSNEKIAADNRASNEKIEANNRAHQAEQNALDRASNEKLEANKLAFEQQKYSDAQIANARKSWWYRK